MRNKHFYEFIARKIAWWLLVAALPLIVLLGLNYHTFAGDELIGRLVLCVALALLAVIGTSLISAATTGLFPAGLGKQLLWFIGALSGPTAVYVVTALFTDVMPEFTLLAAAQQVYFVVFICGVGFAILRVLFEKDYRRTHGHYSPRFESLPVMLEILRQLP